MSDAFVKLLNRLGYQPVFLPRTGSAPPELYNFANGRLVRRGPLAAYLPSSVQFEEERGRAADVEHEHTTGKDHAAATSFLKNALRCVGIDGAPKLDLSFTGKSRLVFAFHDVTYRSVSPAQLDRTVSALSLGAVPEELVSGGELHIAYEYLYARKLLMSRMDQKSYSHDVSIGIEQYLDLGDKGTVEVQSATTLSFRSASGALAAFAFKAGQLRRSLDGRRWSFYPEENMMAAGAASRPFIAARGAVLTVDDTG
ncbi:hypothetical protein ACMHYB_01380 [Sorangium sp. So ce1128]